MTVYLSFCDPERPKGTQFLGAAIVPGDDVIEGVIAAHALGCNPGGEVMGVPLTPEVDTAIGAKWKNRLLSRAEIDEMDRELALQDGGAS